MMATINNRIEKVANQPKHGVAVIVELVWDLNLSPVAVEIADEAMIRGVYQTKTDDYGIWTINNIVPNSNITPEDSLYRITEISSDGKRVIYYILIPDNNTYWVGSILETEPEWINGN